MSKALFFQGKKKVGGNQVTLNHVFGYHKPYLTRCIQDILQLFLSICYLTINWILQCC